MIKSRNQSAIKTIRMMREMMMKRIKVQLETKRLKRTMILKHHNSFSSPKPPTRNRNPTQEPKIRRVENLSALRKRQRKVVGLAREPRLTKRHLKRLNANSICAS